MYIIIVVCVLLLCYVLDMRHPVYTGGDVTDTSNPIFTGRLQLLNEYNGISAKPFYNPMEVPSRLPYVIGDGVLFLGCSSDHKKLAMVDLQFLTSCSTRLVIYVGSAPGVHISILCKLFPTVKFLLIDSRYHMLNVDHVYVYHNTSTIHSAEHAKYDKIIRDKKGKEYENIMKYTPVQLYKSGTSLNLSEAINPNSEDFDIAETSRNDFYGGDYMNLILDIMSEPHRVFVIQDEVTIKLLKLIKKSLRNAKMTNFSLISDLVPTIAINHAFPSDPEYLGIDAINIICVKMLKPEFSILRFKPPYYILHDTPTILQLSSSTDPILSVIHTNVDYVKSHYNLDMIAGYRQKKYMYLDSSDMLIQPWSRRMSDIPKLVITRNDIDKPYYFYEHIEWSMKFTQVNLLRNRAYYGDFYELMARSEHNYDGCFDCMLELLFLGNHVISKKSKTYTKLNIDNVLANFKKSKSRVLELSNMIIEYLPRAQFMGCSFHNLLVKIPKEIYLHFVKQSAPHTYTVYAATLKKTQAVLDIYVTYDEGKYNMTYKKLKPVTVAKNLEDVTSESNLNWLATNICHGLRLKFGA